MKYSTFSLEYSLLSQGKCKLIAGIDEVGRGCLAGPVVAAAVVVSNKCQFVAGVNDSKKMTEKSRISANEQIKKRSSDYAIGSATPEEIDEIGIGKASELAMRRAYENLKVRPDIILIDGKNIKFPRTSVQVTAGDAKHYVISAASVIAKVYRDNLMYELAKEYSGFGFERNVGYGTAEHRAAIKEIGFCDIHRKSFSPIRQMLGWKRK